MTHGRVAKLQRDIYGPRSERTSRLIEQLSLTFEELEAGATEDELAAERAVARTTTVRGFTRRRAERQTFPEHLPRERVVIDPPASCVCCGGNRLRKIGEDVTQTLDWMGWKMGDWLGTGRRRGKPRRLNGITWFPIGLLALAMCLLGYRGRIQQAG